MTKEAETTRSGSDSRDQGIPLPPEIGEALDRLIRRARRILAVRGLLATAAVALAAVLAVMAVDAAFPILAPSVRAVLSAAALAATVAAAVRWVAVPLSRRISRKAVARAVEVRHPEIEERLSTAVEMAGRADERGFGGSRQLLEKVVASAVADAGAVDPEREFSSRSVRRFLWAAAVPTVILAGLLVIWPRQSAILLVRAIAPFSEVGNAWSGRIRTITGDVIVAAGEPVTLEVVVEDPHLERADLRSRTPGDGEETIERMERGVAPDPLARRFVHHIPAVHESFDYRIRGGKAVSASFRVEVRERPAVETIAITLDHPDYTGLNDTTLPPGERSIEALAGTRVTIRATPSRPVASATLTVDGETVTSAGEPREGESGGADDPGERRWRFLLPPGMESTWRLDLADAAGIAGRDGDHPVRATGDERPTVTIVSPTDRDLHLRPTETLPIRYVATEDFGFAAAERVVTPEPGRRQATAMDLPTRVSGAPGESGEWAGELALDLGRIDLGNASLLRVRLHLRDALPEELGGPQEAASEEIRIRIDRNAPTLLEQTLAAQQEEMRQSIHEVLDDLRDTRWRADDGRQRVAQRDALEGDDLERLREVAEGANRASEALDALAAEMERTPFARQAPRLAALADEATRPAAERAAAIPLLDAQDERIAEAEAMSEEIQEAVTGLEETLGALDRMRPELDEAVRLDRLAQEQRAMAIEADRTASASAPIASPDAASPAPQATPPDPGALRDWQQRQQGLAEQIREAAARREALAAQAAAMNARGEEARELAEQAAGLADREALLEEILAGAPASTSPPPGASDEASSTPPPPSGAAAGDPLVAALLDEQAAIAEAATSMARETQPTPTSPSAPQDTRAAEGLEAAAGAATRAADALAAEDLAAATRSAGDAAERLAALQEAFPGAGDDASGTSPAAGPASESPGDVGEAGSEAADSGSDPGAGEPGAAAAADEEAGVAGVETPAGATAPPGDSSGEDGSPEPGSATAGAQPTAEAVAELARRQAAVADLLGALADGRADEGVAALQAAVAEESGTLAEAAEALGSSAGELPMGSAFQEAIAAGAERSDVAAGEAAEAARHLDSAAGSAAAPAEALEQAIAASAEGASPTPAAGAAPASRTPTGSPSPTQGAADSAGTDAGAFAEAMRGAEARSPAQAAAGRAREALADAARAFEGAAESLRHQAAGMAAEAAGVAEAAGQAAEAAGQAGAAAAQAEAATATAGQAAPSPAPSGEGAMASAADAAGAAAEALAEAARGALQAAGMGTAQPQSAPGSMSPLAGTPPGQSPGPPSRQPGQGQPGAPSGEGGEPGEGGPQPNAAYADVPPALARLGITAADWTRIKGTARSGVAGAATGTAPAEYHDLVRAYFEELARQASEDESP